ncbi:MAG: hypothetical protein R3E79_20465 [Caldilineaceae bacterium]
MEENRQQSTGATGSQETSGSATGSQRQSQSTQDLMDELNRLGLKFAEVVQTAWESDERKRLEKDVKAGVVSLVNGLERGLRRMSETDQAKEFLNKAENVADTLGERVRSSQTSHDLASGLAKGLRILAEQIDKLAEEMQHKAASTPPQSPPKPPSASDDSQNIPITKV